MPARTPEGVDALFEEGVNAGDAVAVAALYEENAVLVSQPGKVVQGAVAILEELQGIVGSGAKVSQNIVSTLIAGDVAVLYNDWTGSIRMPDGKELEVTGRAIEVVRRQADGTWLFAIDDPYARS